MKFYKRLPIDSKNPTSNRFTIEADGLIVSTSNKSLQVPAGATEQRPLNPNDGYLRYNTSIGTNGGLEVYTSSSWETLKINQPTTITKQHFTNSNYSNTIFGPLAYDIDVSKPENVLVFVENVLQIADINYTLVYGSGTNLVTATTTVIQTAPVGTGTIRVSSVADFIPGQKLSGGTLTGRTITAVSTTDLTITVTPVLADIIFMGTQLVTGFSTGTYIKFTADEVPVPSVVITTIIGFDGFDPLLVA
jgi:hypothetical protein